MEWHGLCNAAVPLGPQVADVAVEASVEELAANTVVEILTEPNAREMPTPEMFRSLTSK